MSLRGGLGISLTGNDHTFFHCKECGHISHTADTKLPSHVRCGPITADVAAWVATYCEMCGKPVDSERH
jgi:hypothetical protein